MASPKKVVRPRYYSTELGIKDKLAVAVLTTTPLLRDYGVTLNQTLNKHVDKLMFFVDGEASTTDTLGLPVITFPGTKDVTTQVNTVNVVGLCLA